MKISLINAGKRFNREWIFRKVNYVFESGGRYAITGSNGSGKSTLLQAIAGAIAISEGQVDFSGQTGAIEADNVFTRVSLCAPYLELIEEMTALEFLQFHARFKPLIPGYDPSRILDEMGLPHAAHKQIRYFSSGMKQRVKLAQAFYADTPVLLLDEPCTNLDQAGIDLYRHWIDTHGQHRLILVSSNDPQEYAFCTEILSMNTWK